MLLEIVRKGSDVTVELNAHEWQIFGDMDGAEAVVNALNDAASIALSKATPHEAWKFWTKESERYVAFGASDTEPRWVFECLVAKVFGDNYDSRYS